MRVGGLWGCDVWEINVVYEGFVLGCIRGVYRKCVEVIDNYGS
jgi:hypothetical protein